MPASNELLERLEKGDVLFDGGMGSMLIAEGLASGSPPEEWNSSHADVVRGIHRAYLDAGAEVIETNTFGATPGKLSSYGLASKMKALNRAAVNLAREALSTFADPDGSSDSGGQTPEKKRFIAFSVGPTGKMLPPVGDAKEEDIKEEFAAQISCVKDAADLILIETIYDLREALIALETAKTITDAPVGITLTFDKKPRGFYTIMGDEAGRSIRELAGAGADLAGANCTLTSRQMLELAALLRQSTSLPLLCQPNAGEPVIRDGRPSYDQHPEEFAEDMIKILRIGINAAGGCCGTTPAFIRAVDSNLKRLRTT
jgi:5-methyltetrahydrofolate--homocysteine methyltransferase